MPSFRKLPSGKWQASVRHPSGRRFTRSDPLKRVVVEWANDLETQIRRGQFVDPKAGRATLSDWWARWSETRVSERATADRRESLWRVHVEPAFGSWPLTSIQSWDVEAWISSMAKQKVGREAAAASVRLLKQLLSDAVRHQLIATSPAASIETPRVPKHVDRTLDAGEIERLLEAITMPGDRRGVRRGEPRPRVPDLANRLFVKLMLFDGLRWQEAAGLHGFRVDLMRRRLRVQEVVERGRRVKPEPKSAAGQRETPLTDDLVADLSQYMKGRPREGLLFTEADGGPLDYSNWLKRVWNPAVAAAELERPLPTPHDCRHTYGTMLAEEGVPPHEIASLMGHSSLRMVERYIHAGEARFERARGALDARTTHEVGRDRKRPRLPGDGGGA